MLAVYLVMLAILVWSLCTFCRIVFPQRGRFPRCGRCAYPLPDGPVLLPCPECGPTGEENNGAITVDSARRRIPSVGSTFRACLLFTVVLGVAAWLGFEKKWPWRGEIRSDSIAYTVQELSEYSRVSKSVRNTITVNLRSLDHRPPYAGTVVLRVKGPNDRWHSLTVDYSGRVIDADPPLSIPLSEIELRGAVEVLYEGIGFESLNTFAMRTEMDALQFALESVLKNANSSLGSFTHFEGNDYGIRDHALSARTTPAELRLPLGTFSVPLATIFAPIWLVGVVLCFRIALWARRRTIRSFDSEAGGEPQTPVGG